MSDSIPTPSETPSLEGFDQLQKQWIGRVMKRREINPEDVSKWAETLNHPINEDDQEGMKLMMSLDEATQMKQELGSYFQALPEKDQKEITQRVEDQRIRKVDFFPDLYDNPAPKTP